MAVLAGLRAMGLQHRPGAVSACVSRVSAVEGLTVVEMQPPEPRVDYQAAVRLADEEAGRRLGDYMLLSWYDRDRDFESPQHASECHSDSAVPGYVDYGINHGATLKIDIDRGRFVFFYLPVNPDEQTS